jgi:hypothetical protein
MLLVVANATSAQQPCGDLDRDGDVDYDDALLLRYELDGSAPLTLEQALWCDVISEARAPGLEPDPENLAGTCSMSDAAVMARNELALPPGVTPVCALGSAENCCAAHASVGCNAGNTVACVCDQDPSCCTLDWDATCAALACGTACHPICPTEGVYCAGSCCSNPHGTTQCAAGTCAPTCASGWGSCDLDPQNGCETSFDTNPTCPGTNLGTIEGGDSGSVITRSGSGEAHFYVQVLDAGPCFNDYTAIRARLTSPPGSNYNLRITCFNCPGNPGAGPSVVSSAPEGAIDTLYAGSWDDCNEDETAYLVIAVVYASGSSCESWSLELRGNNSVPPNALCSGND